MAEPALTLVSNIDDDIAEIAGDIIQRKKTLARSGSGDNAEILPPDGVIRYDDHSNAERFLAMTGEDLAYSVEAKKWLIWDRTHWTVDSTNLVYDLILAFVKDLYSPEHCTSKEAMSHAIRSNNRNGIAAMLEIAQRKCSVSISSFDQHPYLLNCQNGTLDLKTGELRPHNRADRITRVVNANYDADATSQNFDSFIRTIQPDPTIRAYLQRSIGYSLLGNVRERSFWILYGTGNNGKSVFTNLFNNLLGEYASTTTSASIMAGKQNAIPNDIARLNGKRFIVVPETGENERMNEALVKALSAGDKVSARFLFGEYFDFFFSGKLWIATNHKPTITDHSKGFWDRVKLIPFTTSIPADQVIKSDDLMAALMADAPAVLTWAVQGCRDYFDLDGLDTPEIIQDEINAYRKEQDSIAQFIEEACQTFEQAAAMRPEIYHTPGEFRINNGDLYAAYKKFCEANGEYLRSHRRLAQNMKERGFRQMNSNGRYWEGIRLTE